MIKVEAYHKKSVVSVDNSNKLIIANLEIWVILILSLISEAADEPSMSLRCSEYSNSERQIMILLRELFRFQSLYRIRLHPASLTVKYKDPSCGIF